MCPVLFFQDSIPGWPAGDGEAAVCPVLLFQDSIPVSTSLLGDTSDTTSTGLAQRLGMYPQLALHGQPGGAHSLMEP